MSQQFFEDPASYAAFDLTVAGRDMVACVDPREPVGIEHGYFPVVVQTGGGAVGEGLDAALALTATEGHSVTLETGMGLDRYVRTDTALRAHVDCAMVGSLQAVTAEMAEPSEFTMDSVRGWAGFFGEEEHVSGTLGRVMDAAGAQLELLTRRGDMSHLLKYAARTEKVRGEKGAQVYTVNLHPHMGQNRNAKPADPEEADKVRGYHDSLAASVELLKTDRNLSAAMRGLRLTSTLLRAAALRSVIAGGTPDMTFLEARPADGPDGIRVTEQELQA